MCSEYGKYCILRACSIVSFDIHAVQSDSELTGTDVHRRARLCLALFKASSNFPVPNQTIPLFIHNSFQEAMKDIIILAIVHTTLTHPSKQKQCKNVVSEHSVQLFPKNVSLFGDLLLDTSICRWIFGRCTTGLCVKPSPVLPTTSTSSLNLLNNPTILGHIIGNNEATDRGFEEGRDKKLY